MACGTPVVGFAAGGTPELLTGGRGIAVKTGDQKAFTEAVRKAIGDENELMRGSQLAERIREENSVGRMTERYREIYRSLLGEAGQRNL